MQELTTPPEEEVPTPEKAVSAMYQKVDKTIATINEGKTQEDKRRIFITGNNHLYRFWESANKEEWFSADEREKLEEINEKLKEKEVIIAEIIGRAIQWQKENLKKRNVRNVQTEIKHVEEVVELTQQIYPELFILHLAAAVHDSYKFGPEGEMELGLHELASTMTGITIIRELLRESAKGLGLNEEEINLISRLVQRAILTHGTDEFPEANSRDHQTIKEIGKVGLLLKKDIYPKNKLRSYPPNQEREDHDDIATITVAALNYLDALTGANYNSFIKYSNSYKSEVISSYPDLASFFEDCIFSSFDNNINMPSRNFLLSKDEVTLLDRIVIDLLGIKNVIELSLNGKTRELISLVKDGDTTKIDKALNTLKTAFNKLKENPDETQRSEFDKAIANFITTCYQQTKLTSDQK